ncbi:sugar ABC transporter ATP-binding protein [Glutamicibacter sp. Je.9.36]|uniref:sugar ABC transporter ATP-binding protein n=1 Tax=Glutamicibacter sp. Je.9.36 TaxID=3142837 RepID=UPI003DA9AD1A
MNNLLLEVDGVNKSFPGVRALADMRLNVYCGEVLALVGENGAGKSTLMKLLSGIYAPDSGSFRFDGAEVDIADPKMAQQLGISIIHQEFNLMQHLSVAQNIYIGREPMLGPFINDSALNRRARELFERIGIELDPAQRVSELTVAKQQMVEIAKALSFEARLLILDEPTAALNDAEVETLHGIIRRFITDRTGAIYISHRMDELKVISDRITVIRDGEYIETMITEETTMPEVISKMVGRQVEQTIEVAPIPALGELKISVKDLNTKSLLSDISFDLHKGEILGFAGLMGAGRTEVARALVGADPISSGSIAVDGSEVAISNPAKAAQLGIGYLSEDRKHLGLMLEADVAQNIVLSSLKQLSKFGMMRDQMINYIAGEQIQRLRIKTPSMNQSAKNLSGGNQQKIVIAKWLVKDCDVLIFDEPTRGIDVGAKEEIYALLDELAANGKAIIMISSELPEVIRMSHRIAVMSEGRITGVLERNEATQENIMDLATRSIRGVTV